LQPEKDIVIEFIKNEEFKYVRALGAFYLRLTASAVDCYKYLEPLYNDYRKIRRQNRMGQFEVVHMDEFIDDLLREERVCDVILPRIQKRSILEENGDLEPKVSLLDDDLDQEMDVDLSSEEEQPKKKVEEKPKHLSKSDHRRSRSNSRDRFKKLKHRRDRSKEYRDDRREKRHSPDRKRRRSVERSDRHRDYNDRDRHRDRRDRDRSYERDRRRH
jgi:pre-mRNA-splicing factor 38A